MKLTGSCRDGAVAASAIVGRRRVVVRLQAAIDALEADPTLATSFGGDTPEDSSTLSSQAGHGGTATAVPPGPAGGERHPAADLVAAANARMSSTQLLNLIRVHDGRPPIAVDVDTARSLVCAEVGQLDRVRLDALLDWVEVPA